MVRSEDPHAVQRRGRAFRRGQAAPDHLVLPQLEGHEKQVDGRVSEPWSHHRARPEPLEAAPQMNNATKRAQSIRGGSPLRRAVDVPADLPAVPHADLGPRLAGAAPPPCWPLAAPRARRRRSGTHGPLSSYNPPLPPSRRPRRPHSQFRLRPPPSRSVLTVPDAFMALHRRRSQERKGTGNVRRRLTSSSSPAPATRAAIGCQQSAIGARSCQSPRAALASGLAAPHGPARHRSLQAARSRPNPLLPSPGPRACTVPIEDRPGCA